MGGLDSSFFLFPLPFPQRVDWYLEHLANNKKFLGGKEDDNG